MSMTSHCLKTCKNGENTFNHLYVPFGIYLVRLIAGYLVCNISFLVVTAFTSLGLTCVPENPEIRRLAFHSLRTNGK